MYYPQFDPVIVALGPLALRWYGLMYVLAFVTAYLLGVRRAPAYGFSKQGGKKVKESSSRWSTWAREPGPTSKAAVTCS